MARRRTTTESKDTLESAVARYRAAFGADALPCLDCVSAETAAVAMAMLDHAVKARRPLRHAQIAVALGGDEPPLGGCI